MLANTVNAALKAGCHPILVVLGANAELIRPTLTGLDVQIEYNENWELGMGSSIACGMKRMTQEWPDLEAVVLLVCDQPLLSNKTILGLTDKWSKSKGKIVASKYDDSVGVPALFPKELFTELLEFQGNKGAKSLIMKNLENVYLIPFENGKIDIDCKTDLDHIRGK